MGSQYAEWSQYTTYAVDAVVQYAGQIYVATAVNQNVIPYPPTATWNNISPVNPGILAGYVKNPMDSALQCYNPSTTVNYSIDDAAYVSASEVRTDNINLIPGSLQNAIKINDSIEMRTAQEIRGEQELVFRTTGAYGYKFHNIQSGSQPVMLAYDPATGIVNKQPYIPGTGGTLVGVGAGTAITVDNTNPVFPVVNNDGVLTVNSEKGALTVAAGSGIGVNTVGTTITISNTSPSSGGTLTGVGAGTGVLVDNTVPTVPVVSNDGVLTVNSEKGALTVAAGSGISVSTVGGTITIENTEPLVNFKPTQEFFVATNGNDTTGNGSANNPYATITKAITQAELVATASVINISAGTYTENLVISKGNLCLQGAIASAEAVDGTIVNGLIVVNLTSGSSDLFGNQTVINNLHLQGVISDTTASILHTLIVEDCRIETGAGLLDTHAISVANSVADQRTYITNCKITHRSTATTTNALISIGAGRLLMDRCSLTVRTISSLLQLYGNATLTRLSNSALESDSTSAFPQPMVDIASASASAHALALNTFTNSSATAKTQSVAIGFNRATVGFSIGVLLQNFFAIAGTSPSDIVVSKNANTTLFVEMSGNKSASGTASEVSPGATISTPSYVGEVNPATEWSLNPAISNVDYAGFAIENVNTATATTVVVDTTYSPPVGGFSLKTDDPAFAPENGTVCSITYPEVAQQNATIYAQGYLSLVDSLNGATTAKIVINGVEQINGSAWATQPATANLDMASFDIDNAGTITGTDVVGTTSLTVDGLSVKPVLDFTATNELFVAKNGDDTTGNGSKLQPFATIQKAIDTSDLITPKTGLCVIQIANGDYNESIVISGANGGWIQLNGSATSQNNTFGVVIRGSILIDLDAGVSDLISRQVIFSGLQLNAVITNGSTLEHTVGIQNCRFYPSAASNGVAILDTSTKNRVLIDNCEYTNDYPSTGVPFDFDGESTISFSKCDIQSPNNSSIIRVGGTSYLQRLENCYIQNQFVSPTAPLLNITSTSASTHSIALNIFSIASGSGITTPAIITANGGTLFVVSNNFQLAGTNPTTGNVIQYVGTAPTLIYGNNTAVPLYASGIQSGITLVPLTDVGATAGKFTTLSATSGTIASTTMTGNTISTTGTGQGVVCATVSNGATVLNGRVNITGSASSIAMNVNTGSAATNVIELNGGTYSTNGATNIKITPTTIANAANNTAMTGVNSITMAGTTPAITGANNIAISNANSTVPLDIVNSGDNPHIRCANASASTTVPVEINLVNGALTLAYGNQGTDPRGAFFFFGGKDIIRIQSTLQRVQMSYSPYSPTLAVSGASGAWVAGTGAFVSGVPKLLGTQTITLSASNFPIIPGGFGTPFYLGVNGFINTVVLNGGHDFNITATYTRTRSGITTTPYALYGCAYPVSSRADGAFYSPVNGVSYNELVPAERITFTHGDILTLYIYGTYTGGSPPNIITPGTGLAAVFSPFLI